ncbi:MAG: ribulose-phosphate 3-epimerase [Candidatus Cloacimonetes bacterium]|nr:ribulose-phosphate 3-epimerase [Candidatus Cloacimonadota bacterium]
MPDILIAPSVLSADFLRLGEELAALEAAGADLIHLDLMDGHYVPNLTFGYPLIQAIRTHTSLPLDAHLMVTNPADYVERLADLGVNWISFHQDTQPHSHRLLSKIRDLGMKAGVALNPSVGPETLDWILPQLDYVLLMSVNPGFSGQSFIPSVIAKTAALRATTSQLDHHIHIEVDGGVNAQNAGLLIDAGADMLVSASYIFNSENYSTAINNLRRSPSS